MESAISSIVFYVFALCAIICAFGVVISRNPVTSAMNMALCFASVAAVLFGMGAQFLGIVQIIVYAGAILVLFLFVVMMLDVKNEEMNPRSLPLGIAGILIAGTFAGMVANVALTLPGSANKCACAPFCEIWDGLCGNETTAPEESRKAANYGGALPELSPAAAARHLNPEISPEEAAKADSMPDVKLLGNTLYNQYSIPFVILSFALLSATIGAVALSRKLSKN